MEEDFGMELFDSFNELELPETGMEGFLEGSNPLQKLMEQEGSEDKSEEDEEDPTNNNSDNAEPTTVEEALNKNSEETDASSEEVASNAQGDGEGNDTSPNLYSSVAAILQEQGLLPSLDLESNKINSVDDLVSAFVKERDTLVQEQIKAKLGEQGAEALEAGLSVDEFEQYQNELQTVNSITDDKIKGDIELSKKIIYQDFINQGMSEDKALRTLKRIIDLGDDVIIEDAIESMSNIKEFTVNKFEQVKAKRKQAIEAEKNAEIEREKSIKKSIYDKDEFVKGIKVNKNIKDKIYSNMTQIVGTDPNGRPENSFMKDRREQGVDFDAKLYYFYTITDGFTDFSKLTSKAKSTATKDLEEAFRKTRITNNDTPAYLQDGNSYDTPNYGDIIL